MQDSCTLMLSCLGHGTYLSYLEHFSSFMVMREISNTVGTKEWLSRIGMLWPLNSTRNRVGNLYGSTVLIAWQIVIEDLEKR